LGALPPGAAQGSRTGIPDLPRAIFVGAQAYTEAGGTILRDLFTEDRGSYFEDAALLDRLTMEKLNSIATALQAAEGWKWTSVHIDFPHAHGMRRKYPHPVILFVILFIAGIVGLAVAAWTLAVYALPFMVAVEVGKLAYASGSGLIGAALVGLVAAVVAYGLIVLLLIVLLLIVLRSTMLRIIVALVFAAPAALAGYALIHGIAVHFVPSEIWQIVFSVVGGAVAFIAALMGLVGHAAGGTEAV
jgi:hypothetical protein